MDARRRQILADLGIEVWAPRAPAAAIPVAESISKAPAQAAEAIPEKQAGSVAGAAPSDKASEDAKPFPPLRFHYLRAQGAMCFYGEDLPGVLPQFVRDLVGARANIMRADKPVFTAGEFRWPIVGSGGSPDKALGALMTKLEAEADDWLLITEDIAGEIVPHIGGAARIVEVPRIGELVGDARLKRQVWQRLTRNPG